MNYMSHDGLTGVIRHIDRDESHALVESHPAARSELLRLLEIAKPDAFNRVCGIEKPFSRNFTFDGNHKVGRSARDEYVAKSLQAAHLFLVEQDVSWHRPVRPFVRTSAGIADF